MEPFQGFNVGSDETTHLPLEEGTAISPIDGRYAEQTSILRPYFSEFALQRRRVGVEILYLQALSGIGVMDAFSDTQIQALNTIWQGFTITDYKEIRRIEHTTRHDVKSIEYFLQAKLSNIGISIPPQMIHFGLTSEDITNLAQNTAISDAKNRILVPAIWNIVDTTAERGNEWKSVPMLGRTHGREAPATTLGKEVLLFANRLARKAKDISNFQLTGKLSGVVGNYHDLYAALPNVDWIEFSQNFVRTLGLEPQLFTTQIEPHDRWAELFNTFKEMSVILESFDQNMWAYLSHGYLSLKPRAGQTGSSVMPNKGRNPIDLENSEGNAIFGRGIFNVLADELPNSRFQRHLSDSTIARNIGVPFAHIYLALINAKSDLKDIVLREGPIQEDLQSQWGIITSGIQTKLRYLGVDRPYERLDDFAKQGPITHERLITFINSLPVSEEVKSELLSLSPETYIGQAVTLSELMIQEIDDLRKRK